LPSLARASVRRMAEAVIPLAAAAPGPAAVPARPGV
jgi:hypothetical protein